MARKPRPNIEDGIYHVFARGNDRGVIFTDDRDRTMYLNFLARVVSKMRWRCLAFCLMSNHVHLLIETPEPNLSRGMHRFHGPYTQWFNHRHERSGHLFQGRFGSVRIESDEQLLAIASYISQNPVKAGLVDAPEKWDWGSSCEDRSRWPWLDSHRLRELTA